LTVDGFTAVDDGPPIASDAIEFMGPNPTMGAATMAFALAHEGRVQMRIHDLAGRVVRRIDAGSMSPGRHRLSWDGRDQDGLASRAGLYFVRLEVEGRSLGVRRLVLQH